MELKTFWYLNSHIDSVPVYTANFRQNTIFPTEPTEEKYDTDEVDSNQDRVRNRER